MNAVLAAIEFRRAVVSAVNKQMKLHGPSWDLIDHRIAHQEQDMRTGKIKVAVTFIFEDNGLGLM
jgi:hypothetical protein